MVLCSLFHDAVEECNNIQGHFPDAMGIINKNHDFILCELKKKDIPNTQVIIKKVLKIMRGYKPDSTIAGKTKNSPWYRVALEEAEKSEDISLIYCLRTESVNALRASGVQTIHDLANIEISQLPNIPYASFNKLEKFQLQAQSLIKNEIIPLTQPKPIPDTPLKLYFDIEGNPFLDVDYLFGFWISGDPEKKYAKIGAVRSNPNEEQYFLYFLAEQPEEEASMWHSFLSWIDELPADCTVYHYANYEKTHLTRLADKYSGSTALSRFQNKLVDLLITVTESFIFPLYFYSIKDIAKSEFLNFKWRHQKAGGGQSIFWYEQWLETGNREILQDIIDYNEDDVRATESLYLWIQTKKNRNIF